MIQLPRCGNWTLVKWTFGQGRRGATWASADGGHESRLRGTPLVELLSGPTDQHGRRREARPSDGPAISRPVNPGMRKFVITTWMDERVAHVGGSGGAPIVSDADLQEAARKLAGTFPAQSAPPRLTPPLRPRRILDGSR